jgi:hypothetical protein
MSWDSVPWFVGGGAEHSPEVARLLAFAAIGGAEGIVEPGDLKVLPLDVPSGSVRVVIGAALIRNRATGGAQQTYVARNPTEDVVSISETGSSGGRSDLIVAQIEDPNMAGEPWQDPTDPKVGPYVFTRVIPNVPAGTTRLQDVPGYEGRSAITLARVDLPASTGTVTAALITDLRKLARPRSERQVVKGTLTDKTVTLSTSSWQAFPEKPITGLVIPTWATHAVIRIDTTIRFVSGDGYFNLQSYLGTGAPITSGLFADAIIDSTSGGGSYRQPLVIPSDGVWAIPSSLRGKTVQLVTRVQGRANGGKIATGTTDYYFADVSFMERAS